MAEPTGREEWTSPFRHVDMQDVLSSPSVQLLHLQRVFKHLCRRRLCGGEKKTIQRGLVLRLHILLNVVDAKGVGGPREKPADSLLDTLLPVAEHDNAVPVANVQRVADPLKEPAPRFCVLAFRHSKNAGENTAVAVEDLRTMMTPPYRAFT